MMILGSLKVITEQMNQEDCQQYAYLLLFPIYKLCEGFAGKVVSGNLSSIFKLQYISSTSSIVLIVC